MIKYDKFANKEEVKEKLVSNASIYKLVKLENPTESYLCSYKYVL